MRSVELDFMTLFLSISPILSSACSTFDLSIWWKHLEFRVSTGPVCPEFIARNALCSEQGLWHERADKGPSVNFWDTSIMDFPADYPARRYLAPCLVLPTITVFALLTLAAAEGSWGRWYSPAGWHLACKGHWLKTEARYFLITSLCPANSLSVKDIAWSLVTTSLTALSKTMGLVW